MGSWIQQQTWSEVYECEDTNSKAEMLQNIMKQKLDEFLPTQTFKFTDEDKEWANKTVKKLTGNVKENSKSDK